MTLAQTAVRINNIERTYHFPGGEKVALTDVVELIVRESGHHRLKTADGKLHVVAPGWLHIALTTPDGNWSI